MNHMAQHIHHHGDIIKCKHFPRYWPFVRGIGRSPVNVPHKGQWRRALMFSLICAWINAWVNNREAGETPSRSLWRHYNVLASNKVCLREVGRLNCIVYTYCPFLFSHWKGWQGQSQHIFDYTIVIWVSWRRRSSTTRVLFNMLLKLDQLHVTIGTSGGLAYWCIYAYMHSNSMN